MCINLYYYTLIIVSIINKYGRLYHLRHFTFSCHLTISQFLTRVIYKAVPSETVLSHVFLLSPRSSNKTLWSRGFRSCPTLSSSCLDWVGKHAQKCLSSSFSAQYKFLSSAFMSAGTMSAERQSWYTTAISQMSVSLSTEPYQPLTTETLLASDCPLVRVALVCLSPRRQLGEPSRRHSTRSPVSVEDNTHLLITRASW